MIFTIIGSEWFFVFFVCCLWNRNQVSKLPKERCTNKKESHMAIPVSDTSTEVDLNVGRFARSRMASSREIAETKGREGGGGEVFLSRGHDMYRVKK